MCEKKKNSKSIRLTDEVLNVVESCPGEGFNQKFENLVLEFKKGDEERKKRVAYYDKLIETRKKQLAEIAEQAEEIANATIIITKDVSAFQTKVNKMQCGINQYIRQTKSCIY